MDTEKRAFFYPFFKGDGGHYMRGHRQGAHPKVGFTSNLLGMAEKISIEVVGLRDSTCSPFPCDMTRSCGLYDCHPTGRLVPAFEALKKELLQQFGESVEMRLTLIDEDMPEHIREIIASHYPPIPFIMINGALVPMGRISLPLIQKEIEKRVKSGDS